MEGLYRPWGTIFAERNDIAGALEADRKPILFYLKDNVPKIKLATAYNNLGYDFNGLKQSDSSHLLLSKNRLIAIMIMVSPLQHRYQYLLFKHDTTKFLEYL